MDIYLAKLYQEKDDLTRIIHTSLRLDLLV